MFEDKASSASSETWDGSRGSRYPSNMAHYLSTILITKISLDKGEHAKGFGGKRCATERLQSSKKLRYGGSLYDHKKLGLAH